ncbi:MAG: class I SAM-dependent methyltransferase [Novosphingobium sp.]|nr:class I SAM-dependent methyltransferase [Novosphingobium sp.]
MKFILNENQHDRDVELAKLLNLPLEKIQKLPMCTPDSIRISNGDKPENLEDLYHDYEHLNFPAYLRTLMMTSATRRHPALFELLRETKNKICLDFGSGVGTHAIALHENSNIVHLLDVPGKLFDFAKKRLTNIGCEFFIWFNNNMALPEDYYDVVICSDCLEHVQSPIKELKRIHKSMKVGGILHLLVSTMRKPSSGHFDSSIDEWIKYGKKFMIDNFYEIKPTIYQKKEK